MSAMRELMRLWAQVAEKLLQARSVVTTDGTAHAHALLQAFERHLADHDHAKAWSALAEAAESSTLTPLFWNRMAEAAALLKLEEQRVHAETRAKALQR